MKQTSDRDRKSFGLPNDAFVFFYAADSGSVLGRKNPGAFVDAYVREFKISDGACCLVKLHYSEMENKEVSGIFEISKRRPDVILMRDIFSERDIHRLFQLIDCYVSPHRSEGLGLTVIEAMSAGKPVIATPYGGVTDFVSRDTAFTIDYDLIEVGENNAPYPAGYIWADPDVKSIQGHMRHVFENPEHAKHVAGKGANHVRNMFSIENTSIAIRKELERIWRNGEEPPVWE